MGAIDPRDKRQDNYANSCRRSGRMAVVTCCGSCQQPVVGVTIRSGRGRYSMECKHCGYSATSHFHEAPLHGPDSADDCRGI